MIKIFLYYFLLFFIYSVLGWIVETITCSYYEKKIVINRGFLIGPYLPIYGSAAILMIIFLTEYKSDPFVLFCMASVYASLLEYFTSYIMEKLFHARWWDYTNEKFNIDGRICLKNCLLFGLLGFVVLYTIHPAIVFVLDKIPPFILYFIAWVIFVLFVIDVSITLHILTKLDIQIKNINSDATEEIDKEVKKLLKHYRIFYRRLLKSFPKIRFENKYGNLLKERLHNQLNEFDKFLEDKKKEIKNIKKNIKKLKESNAIKESIQREKDKLKEIKNRKI